MAQIELLFFSGCPHVPAAREQLRRALVELGLPLTWSEVDVNAPGVAESLRAYGSPTVLVDGRDVTGEAPEGGAACRVYFGSEVPGAPPMRSLIAALRPE